MVTRAFACAVTLAAVTLACTAAAPGPVPSSPQPVETGTPAAGGKGAPANPQQPGGASPSPSATTGPPNDPCGGLGRLLATLNRPTIGYSACAIPPGAIVLEEGYQNTVQRGPAAAVQVAFPQGFERFGVTNRFELDAIGPNDNLVRAGGVVSHGFNDLGLGFKYELPPKGRFIYGVDGLFTAASGASGFTGGGPSETLDVDIAYAASPSVGVGTTLAASSSSGAAANRSFARYGFALPSLVLTAQIPHEYQFYAEVVAQTKLAPGQGGRVFTDFGLQKLLGEYLEVDAEYGADFTPVFGSQFHYFGIGTGIRVR